MIKMMSFGFGGFFDFDDFDLTLPFCDIASLTDRCFLLREPLGRY